MILVRNGEKRSLTDIETIKIFKQAGWTEEKTVVKPVVEDTDKTEVKTKVKFNPRKNNK